MGGRGLDLLVLAVAAAVPLMSLALESCVRFIILVRVAMVHFHNDCLYVLASKIGAIVTTGEEEEEDEEEEAFLLALLAAWIDGIGEAAMPHFDPSYGNGIDKGPGVKRGEMLGNSFEEKSDDNGGGRFVEHAGSPGTYRSARGTTMHLLKHAEKRKRLELISLSCRGPEEEEGEEEEPGPDDDISSGSSPPAFEGICTSDLPQLSFRILSTVSISRCASVSSLSALGDSQKWRSNCFESCSQ